MKKILLLLVIVSCSENEISKSEKEGPIRLEATPVTAEVVKVTSSMSDGTYNQGDKVTIEVEMDEVVEVKGSPYLELAFDTGVQMADYVTGSGSSRLVFEYTIASGDKALKLAYTNAAALKLNSGKILRENTELGELVLPSPGSENSFSHAKNIKVGVSDDFNKTEISSQWVQIDKDNHDMDGDCNTTNDHAMVFSQSNGALTLNGRGRDIWRRRHEFVGVYLDNQVGDFDYAVKIIQRNVVKSWSKAGLMISSDMSDLNLGGTLQCVTTPRKRIVLQHEGRKGDISRHQSDRASSSALPVWIRLQKVGNQVTCYYKYNEVDEWSTHSKGTITLDHLMGTFDVGIVSSAHNRRSNSVVQFDEFIDLDQE